MKQPLELEGFWWVPDAPDEQLAGRLITDNHSTKLILTIDTPGRLPFSQSESRNYDLIHGRTTSGKQITLLHCFDLNTSWSGIYEGSEVEEFCIRFFDGEDAQKLSPLIDAAANRFNVELALEDKEKIDYKVKAKQFVKIYGQVASIMTFEVLAWEKLFWFLKFLVPKLKIEDPGQDELDELLESVDLSTYGLERTKLGHAIGLDNSKAELDPQNPNPRGHRGEEEQADPLDEIIRSFNERWFQGWSATPEEQRVKFINILDSIRTHPDYSAKYGDNQDPYSRSLALEQMLKDVMLKRRKEELELYKLYASDEAFKTAWFQNIERALSRGL